MSAFDVAKKYLEYQPAWIEKSDPVDPAPTPEALTAKVLAEFNPDEADRIVTAWREILGISLDAERVRRHLEGLRKWQESLSVGRRTQDI